LIQKAVGWMLCETGKQTLDLEDVLPKYTKNNVEAFYREIPGR
jgi:hypothetical protein